MAGPGVTVPEAQDNARKHVTKLSTSGPGVTPVTATVANAVLNSQAQLG